MQCSRLRAPVSVALVALAGIVATPSVTSAEGADDGSAFDPTTDEVSDPVVLDPEAARQLVGPGPAIARTASTGLEDFTYDDLNTEGRAADICLGSLQQGTSWTYTEVQRRFGGSPGTLYTCRERWDVATNPNCDGQVIDPVTNPDFETDCWSAHAEGRSLDLMVGRVGAGYNTTRGNNVVNWLLAPDAAGNQNAIARQLGVQQILFNNRCWNSSWDRGVRTASQMRVCGIGHYDHVHIDMTVRGAAGTVAYWGTAPPPAAPMTSSMFAWDDDNGRWNTLWWRNLRPTTMRTGHWPTMWTVMHRGDFDADADEDEMLFWDPSSGRWTMQTWTGFAPANVGAGSFPTEFDRLVVGDFDGAGTINDVMLWSTGTGAWQVYRFTNLRPVLWRTGTWPSGVDEVIIGDLDDNERRNDTITWDRDTGQWASHSWNGNGLTPRGQGRWPAVYDLLVAADLDSYGAMDETLIYRRDTGFWIVLAWQGFQPVSRRNGTWAPGIDQIHATDLDTEGRLDDLFTWDQQSGAWEVHSFLRYVPSRVLASQWPTVWDRFAAASLD